VRVADLPVMDFDATQALVRATGRPALVSLWATWCGPCVEEMATLSELRRAFGDRLLVLGLATDDARRAAPELQAVFDARRPAYPQALLNPGGEDRFLGQAGGAWDGLLPKTVTFDASGRPLAILDGALALAAATALAERLVRGTAAGTGAGGDRRP
jgi:thiol-disulfide isomerase/thioredoxin